MKPYIVFFGDNVPKDRIESIRTELSNCDALIALGTSLQVYSSFRLVF